MRSRNIKPGFFKNADLAEINPIGRLLFIGLWCLADREGRLEERPKQIAAEVLPYDVCDVTAVLQQLEQKGFLERYSIKDRNYIQINNFLKHQRPHLREAPSTILGSAKARPRHDPGTTKAVPSTCLGALIPDSPFLIPDSKRKSMRFEKPTAALVSDYARSVAFELDGQAFVDYYDARGWLMGKSHMKDWRAAVRTWKKRSKPGAEKKENLIL